MTKRVQRTLSFCFLPFFLTFCASLYYLVLFLSFFFICNLFMRFGGGGLPFAGKGATVAEA